MNLNMKHGVNPDTIIRVVIIVFFIALFVFICFVEPFAYGELDDYSFPVASILNTHNFAIEPSDIEYYRTLFPDFAELTESYSLSGFNTLDGTGELTWYFPVYSLVCVPLTVLFKLIHVKTVFAFQFTNYLFWLGSVLFVCKFLKTDDKRIRYVLMLLLTVNPIINYLTWVSAEVVIYSLIAAGMTCWYNRWFRRAAVFISAAAIMNPTVFMIGILMIIDYFINLYQEGRKNKPAAVLADIISYGACYIIGLIPFGYFYYHTGHFNLSAAYDSYTSGGENVFQRFFAYLFDLNYGLLPFFLVSLILFFIYIPLSIIRKKVRGLLFAAASLGLVFAYSLMVHINSGMSGISRYNAWGVVPLLFCVACFSPFTKEKINRGISILLAASVSLTLIVTLSNPFNYMEFSPIASFVLDNCPGLYNPLHSTFRSRTIHIDGGYAEYYPVVYMTGDGVVTKILASSEYEDELIMNYYSEINEEEYEAIVDSLTDDPAYINIPRNLGVRPKPGCIPNQLPAGYERWG